ncbi:MAG: outer membrane beta-barrel domain-containing protein [Bdellovibrionota bacterium]
MQPSDSFRKQISMGLSYLYHITESISVEALHVNFLTNLSTGFADDLSENTGLEIERVEPVVSIGSALQWAPFRGKSATATNIYHFEGYFFLGGGLTQFEVGSSGMMMGGLGARLFMNRRSTLKFEVRDYYDFKEDVGNRVNIVIGAEFFRSTQTMKKLMLVLPVLWIFSLEAKTTKRTKRTTSRELLRNHVLTRFLRKNLLSQELVLNP